MEATHASRFREPLTAHRPTILFECTRLCGVRTTPNSATRSPRKGSRQAFGVSRRSNLLVAASWGLAVRQANGAPAAWEIGERRRPDPSGKSAAGTRSSEGENAGRAGPAAQTDRHGPRRLRHGILWTAIAYPAALNRRPNFAICDRSQASADGGCAKAAIGRCARGPATWKSSNPADDFFDGSTSPTCARNAHTRGAAAIRVVVRGIRALAREARRIP